MKEFKGKIHEKLIFVRINLMPLIPSMYMNSFVISSKLVIDVTLNVEFQSFNGLRTICPHQCEL